MAEPRRLQILAAALTLLSGAVMMLAGYVGHGGSWMAAGAITLPGGMVILAAFAVAHRADRADGRTIASHSSLWAIGAGALTLTLLSGGVMVMAGYAVSASRLGLASLLAGVGGLLIGAAFAVDRYGFPAIRRP